MKSLVRGPFGRLLANTELVELTGGRAVLDPEQRALVGAKLEDLGKLFTRVTGNEIVVELKPETDPASTASEETTGDTEQPESDDLHIRAREHPLVKAALEVFDAEIVDVRPKKK